VWTRVQQFTPNVTTRRSTFVALGVGKSSSNYPRLELRSKNLAISVVDLRKGLASAIATALVACGSTHPLPNSNGEVTRDARASPVHPGAMM
jgi:hypothetical protein